MAGYGGKREGAGRKPGYKAKVAEAYNELLAKEVEKAKLPIITALIDKAKIGDVVAIKEIHERISGKVPQALTGNDGKDLFPAPLLANLDVHNNNRNKKNSDSVKTDTGSTGGNVSQQDGVDTLIPD
jgi:hypothetical protein